MNSTQLNAWLQKLKVAWESKDPQTAADLCSTQGFEYYEVPYKDSLTTKDEVYKVWQEVPQDQSDIQFDYDIITSSQEIGVAHWQAVFRSKSSGKTISLDGVLIIQLDTQGLCTLFKQWWVEKK